MNIGDIQSIRDLPAHDDESAALKAAAMRLVDENERLRRQNAAIRAGLVAIKDYLGVEADAKTHALANLASKILAEESPYGGRDFVPRSVADALAAALAEFAARSPHSQYCGVNRDLLDGGATDCTCGKDAILAKYRKLTDPKCA